MNTRCHHNNWAIDCDTCKLESLRAKYSAVCDELEQAQNELDKLKLFGNNPLYNDAIKIQIGDKVVWEKK